MRKAVIYLIFSDILFMLILLASSLLSGAFGSLLYYLSFILPVIIAFLLAKRSSLEVRKLKIKMFSRETCLFLPIIFPTLAIIFFVSFLTSIVLTSLGVENSVPDVSGNVFLAIFLHALLPALLEELLFRYLPLSLLLPYSRTYAVLLSSLLFSLAHGSLYQIPYAFLAGLIFAFSDIVFSSVLPSFIMHFINNVISVLWLRNCENEVFRTVYILILIALAVISLALIAVNYKKYKHLCEQ